MRKLALTSAAVTALSIALQLSGQNSLPVIPACSEDIDVRIMPDKQVYPRGATAHVEFLIRNAGNTPLFLFKNISQCSSPLGWLSLQIRDSHGAAAKGFECAVDYLMNEMNPARELSNSKLGIVLQKDEIFGKRQEYTLPKEKGLYRLQGEIGQVGVLNDEQEKELSEHHMRILRHTCSSAIVTIEVK